ncbi:MAG TPA: N-acyl homoserine lactonase family protein [Myxococcaceae bacterium]|nr:N-acyl homoserine lactonase family protein [Myxococcaceae bacterium]
MPQGKDKLGAHWTARRTLVSQLAELGLRPDDIQFVGLSHLHLDHAGNVALFPKATWLLAPAELAWARAGSASGVDPALIRPLAKVRVRSTEDDLDVFGDGSVTILRAPGHTPGHRVLLLKLPNAGAVLLSGDLFHTRENYEKSLIPAVNVSRAETMASIARFSGLVKRYGARVIVQHAPEDVRALPAFPAALD